MEVNEKIISLYNYISETIKLSKTVIKNVKLEKWYLYLDDIPMDNSISVNKNYFEEEKNIILKIKKPNFLKPLILNENIKDWIIGDWDNYKENIKIKQQRIFQIKKLDNEIEEQVINIDDGLKKYIIHEIEEREIWVKQQKTIEKIRKLFNDLYINYLDLNKNNENYELILANGILEIKQQGIYYPILLKKVKIDFDALANVLKIKDIDSSLEVTSQFYIDFLNDVEGINSLGMSELNAKISEENIEPLDETKVDELFREFIHKLSINGIYEKDITDKISAKNADIIYNKPLFFIRKKESGILKAIDQIVEDAKEQQNIPIQLLELIGLNNLDYYKNNDNNEEISSEEILFAKESNEDQLEIAKQIEKNNAVVVQGPPGTGKTHTIANLLGHFLSQGKNILVTSQTKKALKVLKDKIPNSIKGLCISVLDDDNKDLVQSVDAITDKIGILSSQILKNEIKEISDKRRECCETLRKIKRELFAIKFKESKQIVYGGKSFSIKEIGEYLRNNNSNISEIRGIIKEDYPCPISNNDFKFLINYRNCVNLEEEKEFKQLSLDIELLSKKNYEKMISTLNAQYSKLKEEIKDEFSISDKKIILKNESSIDLIKFKNCKFVDELIPERLKNLKEWQVKIILMGAVKNANYEKMRLFLDELKIKIESINKKSIQFWGKSIKYDLPNTEIRKLIEDLKKGLENPGFLFLKNRLKKAKENIGEKILINNRKLETIEDCDLVLVYLELENIKDDLLRKWKSFEIADISIGDILNTPDEVIKTISYYLNWYDKDKEKFIKCIDNTGIDFSLIFDYEDDALLTTKINKLPESIKRIENFIKIAEKALKYFDARSQYEKYLETIESKYNENSSTEKNLYLSIKNKDINSHNKYVDKLLSLSEKKDVYNRRSALLDIVRKVAQQWAIDLETGMFENCKDDVNKLWELKQLSQKLEKMRNAPYEKMRLQCSELKKIIKELTLDLIEKKSWYHVISFVEKKENLTLNQALRGWKQSMQKIGKGTGKNVALYRKQAKEKMNICQKAVPAWIMPMDRVIDTLNPVQNKFDIIIIDEASQCDISSLVLLYMAKKIIVVGDDKQVSPSGVGKKIEAQNKIREKYIQGKIPNDDLYDCRSSLYSLAMTTYRPLMLREHFRCVPEIISYSNKTSYDNKIKPLRESSSSNLKPAVINYRVDGKRDENKKINIVEAETIVSLIASCIEEEIYENLSFGVISLLGKEQAELIQRMLVEKIGNIEIDKHNILCGDSSYFQGDEKDVIFLSMVDSNKNPELPLNKKTEGADDSYKKRYNVAVSRAKDQIWIVHSLDINCDLKSGDIRRELLEFSYDPKSFMINETVELKSDSIFEEEVAKYLIAHDYNIEQQWEVGSYRIDMVVIYGDKKIALECDGERWHSTEEQIRSDIERQDILERCGWKFIRIRGSKYFRNPKMTMEDVIIELENNGIYPEKREEHSCVINKNYEILEKIKNRAGQLLIEWHEEINENSEI